MKLQMDISEFLVGNKEGQAFDKLVSYHPLYYVEVQYAIWTAVRL